jgi:hypothetical protein
MRKAGMRNALAYSDLLSLISVLNLEQCYNNVLLWEQEKHPFCLFPQKHYYSIILDLKLISLIICH